MKTALIFICSVVLSQLALSQWIRTAGPEGAAIRTLTTLDGVIYAGTDVDGVYISTDDGVTWTPRNEGIATYGVSSILHSQGYLYAGTTGGGVYRSSDDGRTWTAPSSGNTLFITSMVANDPYIFAGAGSLGVYRSSDNGETWAQVLPVFGVGAMCKSGKRIFVSESNYTDYTTDNGATWTNVEDLEGAIIFSYYTKGDTIFAGGQTKLYRSTDRGDNFTTITIDLGFSLVNISAFAAVGSTMYAATSYDGVYSSTDFGSTWLPANEGMGPKDVRALTLGKSAALIAGTHYVGVYRSTNLGASWAKSVSGFPAGSSIAEMLTVGQTVFAGTRNDGLYQTTDNGTSWKKLVAENDTINYGTVRGVCMKDGVIYAAFTIQFHTVVYKSADGGNSWVRSGTGLPADLTFVFGMATSGANVLAATDEGIYYSSNNGESWMQASIPPASIPSIAAGGGSMVYAPDPGVGIYRSLNSGVDWFLSLQSNVDYVEVEAFKNHAFAGSFFDGARYSSNSGSTWFRSVGFPAGASVFAFGATTDGIIFAGTDLDPEWVYASFNNGVSFSPYGGGLAAKASVEAFAANDSFMFAGTDDHGVWRRLLPGVVGVADQDGVPAVFRLEQNHPNPFNPTTRITFEVPESRLVSLKVYDLLGREVATLVSEEKEPGSYEATWDASDMPSGVYFYRLRAGNLTQTRKLALVK